MSHSHSTKKLEGDRPAGTTPGPKVGSPGAARAFQPHSQTLQKPARPKTRNSKRRSAYKSGPSLLWLLPFGLVALAVVAIFLVLLGGNQISGRLAAEKTSYDFGQVKLNGGLVTTQIPLKVQEDGVLVSKIATT